MRHHRGRTHDIPGLRVKNLLVRRIIHFARVAFISSADQIHVLDISFMIMVRTHGSFPGSDIGYMPSRAFKDIDDLTARVHKSRFDMPDRLEFHDNSFL